MLKFHVCHLNRIIRGMQWAEFRTSDRSHFRSVEIKRFSSCIAFYSDFRHFSFSAIIGLLFALFDVGLQSFGRYVLFMADILLWTIAALESEFHLSFCINWKSNLYSIEFHLCIQGIMKPLMELSASLDTYRPNSAALFRSLSANSKTELVNNDRKWTEKKVLLTKSIRFLITFTFPSSRIGWRKISCECWLGQCIPATG